MGQTPKIVALKVIKGKVTLTVTEIDHLGIFEGEALALADRLLVVRVLGHYRVAGMRILLQIKWETD